MKYCLVVFALLLGAPCAAETLMICYGYDCAEQARIHYSKEQLSNIAWIMSMASGPIVERSLISQAVGRLYGWAGQQSLIQNDRGGNLADEDQPGRMDCIDHATSTTRLLKMMENRGWLKWHRVLAPAKRTRALIFSQHFSAVVEDLSDQSEDRFYVVDSWFVNNGEPAVVMPLADWETGGGPDVD